MTDYEKIEQIKALISELLGTCGIASQVEFEESITKGLIFNISSPDSRLLIGREGATLHALQVLVQALAARRLQGGAPPFSLDVDDYKRKREWYLKETAKAAADHVRKTGRPVALQPMPNYERRYVHTYLQEHHPEVFSESQGAEPRRRITIKPRRSA